MKNLTEERLLDLGFEKVTVSPDESLEDRCYCYFIYGSYDALSLISNTDDDPKTNGYYYVEFFNYPDEGKMFSYRKVKKLIKLLESIKK